MSKLTDKQKAFCDYYIESLNAVKYKAMLGGRRILIHNKLFENITPEAQTCIIIDSLAVLISEEITDYNRKKAAMLLLKAFLPGWRDVIKDDFVAFDRHDKRIKEWRRNVLKKDKNMCVNCGSENNLEAHHILKWSDYPRGRIDVNNGVTLCLECHVKEHSGDQVYYMMRGKVKCKN